MAKNLIWYGRALLKKVENATERALTKVAIEIVNTAKKSMTEPKTGVDYSETSKAMKRQSSAKGEPPAVQTGKLRASLSQVKSKPLTRRIGTNLPYGKHLEFGTKRIKPRPYLRPAFEKNKKRLAHHLKGTV